MIATPDPSAAAVASFCRRLRESVWCGVVFKERGSGTEDTFEHRHGHIAPRSFEDVDHPTIGVAGSHPSDEAGRLAETRVGFGT